jgi:N-acetylmuramoyl-L-alanine amidase
MSPNYPATVTEVVYQRISGRYQYSPVADGRIKLEPNEKAWRAAYAALAGWDPTEGATGFFNPAKTRDRWVHSRPATTQIGGHVFFN